MELFRISPVLFKFENCKEFTEIFQIQESDFILASKSSYLRYFQNLKLKARVVFKNDYGSGEPTDVMCETIMKELRKGTYTRIIAIGGGAVIDIAKVLSIAGEESIDELYQKAPLLEKRRKLIVVPTTCGTGSEVTNISILSRTRLNTKVGLISDNLFPDSAALIPELLEELPYSVFATSSLDAFVHGVESTLSPKANKITRMFSYQSIQIILRGYREIEAHGKQARISLLGDFLLASTYAGIAFGNAGCAAVHALSYPLGTTHHVPHGESNYAIFSGVIRKYQQMKPEGELIILADIISKSLSCDRREAFIALENLLSHILTRKPLHEYGVKQSELALFTDSVLSNQQRLLSNSFIPLSGQDILEIYQSLY